MDISVYLKRINYTGSLIPSAEVLCNLHLAHMQTVPFENLSIHSGEPIVLQNEELFKKIVIRRRGGFCYELNGLFAELLRKLGFNVSMLSAEVAAKDGGFSPPFDHMTLLVNLRERWLADVGFGDSFITPLLLDSREIQQQGKRSYRIDIDGDYFILLEKKNNEEWKPFYRFTLKPYEYKDFEEMCIHNQTSPDSHFTQNIICSVAKPDGRITVSSSRIVITENENKQEKPISGPEEISAALEEYFKIKISNFQELNFKRNS